MSSTREKSADSQKSVYGHILQFSRLACTCSRNHVPPPPPLGATRLAWLTIGSKAFAAKRVKVGRTNGRCLGPCSLLTRLIQVLLLLQPSFLPISRKQLCVSCDGRVVKALDLKSNGVSPRRFEPCSQRYVFLPLFFLSLILYVAQHVVI